MLLPRLLLSLTIALALIAFPTSARADDASAPDKPPEEQPLRLRRSIERGPDGAKRWEASYDDYVDVDGQAFPTNVRFIDAVNDAETTVRVKSISLNPEVPEGTFYQEPTPGMSIELASCS